MNEKICAISICRDGNENWYHLIPHPQAMHPWVSWKPQAMQCMDTPGTLLGILKSLWIWRDSNKNLSPPWSNAWVNQPLPSASSFRRVQQLFKATPDTCMGTCWYLQAFIGFIGYILVLLCRPRHPLKVTFLQYFWCFQVHLDTFALTWLFAEQQLKLELLFKIECRLLHASILWTCPSPLPAWSMRPGALEQHSRPVPLYVYFCIYWYTSVMVYKYTAY